MWRLLLAVLLVAPWGLIQADPADYRAYDGAALYMRFCASCHGRTGLGDGPVSGALAVMVPDLTRLGARSKQGFDRDKIYAYIDGRRYVQAHGTREMPVWGMGFWLERGADEAAQAEVTRMIDSLVDHLAAMQTTGPAGQ
jgi:hypothetical protein